MYAIELLKPFLDAANLKFILVKSGGITLLGACAVWPFEFRKDIVNRFSLDFAGIRQAGFYFGVAAAVVCSPPVPAALALSPDISEAVAPSSILAPPSILEQLGAGSVTNRELATERIITSPIASAFHRLYPEYRMSDLPQCDEVGTDHGKFKFNKIKYLYSATPPESLPPVLELAVSPIGAANAFIFPAIHEGEIEEEAPRIVLTNGLLDELTSEGHLAFVIGHEIGHLTSGHLPLSMAGFVVSPEQQEKIGRIERQWEFEADKFAADLLYSRGYGAETVRSALAILSLEEHSADEIGSHPKIEERLENLGFSVPSPILKHQKEAPHQTAAAGDPTTARNLP